MSETHIDLEELQRRLTPEAYAERVAAAKADAERLEQVLARVAAGKRRSEALRELYGHRSASTGRKRLKRYEAGGWEALVDRRAGKPHKLLTDEVKALVRGMLLENPELRSKEISEKLAAAGHAVAPSTLRGFLHEEGLSHPVGRPSRSGAKKAEPHPLAGAELWKATDFLVGASAHLNAALGRHLKSLPEPVGEVLDDRAHRDERGRFLPEYNRPRPRTEPELDARFDTVEHRRAEKDLRAMRVVGTSDEVRHRKNLALTLLPVLVDTPRWTVLKHWQGAHLGPLVGHAYQPATLDKYARELKLSGAYAVMREAVAGFWARTSGEVRDPVTGAVLVYVDATTKPLWTHHFTKSTKVSQTGRVMPATSTVFLHDGAGTPLLYRSFSGQVSVPEQVPELLRSFERVAGEGTARRVVVLDRESHAAWLFKELEAKNWLFIVPLRKAATGPRARFEDLGPWEPYGEEGDEVREGALWLNDSRKGEPAVRLRVVGRKRHRTGRVAWFATNTDPAEFSAAEVVRLYFDRWPLQEQVFRNGKGRVGLDVQHGYGKRKITDVAVLDRLERLAGRMRRLTADRETLEAELDAMDEQLDEHRQAVIAVERRIAERTAALDASMAAGESPSDEGFRASYHILRNLQDWLADAKRTLAEQTAARDAAAAKLGKVEASLARLADQRLRQERKLEIFTVDTELDQIMLAYKLTFMNVANHLMREFLGDVMEMDTLIRSVLQLPGERLRTRTTETIRIWRQPRDPRAMAAVERACERFNARNLVRDGRRLRFELVDAPA